MKLGIIGTGNLAEAMVRIFLKNKVVSGSDISIFDVNKDKLNYWAGTYDVIPCEDVDTVIQSSEILFIAVGGQSFGKVISNADLLLKTYRPLVVILSGGRTLEEIEDMMNFITPMARVATNLNISVGAGISAYCFNELVTDDQKGTLVELFSGAGQLVEIDESLFDDFSAIAATASACACELAEIITTCGVSYGLQKDMAMKTAIQCIYGTMKMIVETKTDPQLMLSKLCPPGSGTVNAVLKLKENGFEKAVIRGFETAVTNNN